VADASFKDHRPIECLAVERDEHVVVGKRLPECGEHAGFLGIIPHEQQLDSRMADDVAQKIAEYNLLALPVVDEIGDILGIVTVDDAIELLLPKDWRQRLPRLLA